MDDGPQLHVIRPPDPGEDWRVERDRVRRESRQVARERMTAALVVADGCGPDPGVRAEAVLEGFFVVRDVQTGQPCDCGCHPQLPRTDLHEYGAACRCRLTGEQRRELWERWQAQTDAFWDAAQGRAITAEHAAQEAVLAAWVAAQAGVVLDSHGGQFPEQWRGSVEGHSFYFRERSDRWRIELDLGPDGRFVEIRQPGTDEKSETRYEELESGEIIAQGTTEVEGYGTSPVQRAAFIVDTIRTHLRRRDCTVHTAGRDRYEALLPGPLRWCFACGARIEQSAG